MCSGRKGTAMSGQYIDVPVHLVKSNPKNTRTHSRKQIRQIAASIRELGFAAPILIDEHNVLIAGHGRWQASLSLGMTSIPAIRIDGLSEAKKQALMIADNRIAQSAGWDRERLAIELAALPELLIEDGLDISVTGFEPARSTSCMPIMRTRRTIRPTKSMPAASMVRRSHRPATYGTWVNISCSVAMPGRTTSLVCSARTERT